MDIRKTYFNIFSNMLIILKNLVLIFCKLSTVDRHLLQILLYHLDRLNLKKRCCFRINRNLYIKIDYSQGEAPIYLGGMHPTENIMVEVIKTGSNLQSFWESLYNSTLISFQFLFQESIICCSVHRFLLHPEMGKICSVMTHLYKG